MATIGLRLSAGSGGWEEVLQNARNQRSYSTVGGPFGVEYVAPSNGYIYFVGAWMKRSENHNGKNPRIWFAIYEVTDEGEPGRLLGHTQRLDVGNSGQEIGGSIIWTNPLLNAAANGSVRVNAGQRIGIGFKVERENVEIASIGPSGEYFFRDFGSDGVPPSDPFFASGSSGGRPIALFAILQENLAPAATQVSPSEGAALNPQAISFVGSYVSTDSAHPLYDRMKQFHIEVSRVSDSAILWDFLTDSTPAERLAMTFSRPYAGLTLLEPGTTYRWRIRVADDHYTFSPWTGYRTFTINPLGQVNTASDPIPIGKIDNDASAQTWRGKWHHPSALAMNQATVHLLRAADLSTFKTAVHAFAPTIASAALPGTVFNVPAQTEFGIIPPGKYAYQITGRATDGQESPKSDPPAYFSVNSPPTVPSNLQPPTGNVTTSLPFVEWNIDDPDDDDVMGIDADSELEFVRPNGSVVTVITSNWDSDTGRGFFQTTTTQLNAFGIYKWRVRGRDTSAGASGISAWSVQQTFEYVLGPVITITNPTFEEVEGSVQPLVQFNVAAGVIARYEVRLYDQDAILPRKSSGEIVLSPSASSAQFIMPAGWVRNLKSYDLEVAVWDATNVLGRSLRWPFSMDFDPAVSPLGFQASGIADRHDPIGQTSTVLLSWDISQLNPNVFGGYNVYRRLATESTDDWILLRTLSAIGQNRWRDYWAPPNRLLIYGLSQMERVGVGDEIDIIESDIVESQVELFMETAVLNSVFDPSLRFPIMHLEEDIGGTTERPEAGYVTWGSNNKMTEITTPAESDTSTVDISVKIKSDDRGHLYDHLRDWKDLVRSGHPVCARFENPEEFMYAAIKAWDWQRSDVGTRELSFSLVEIDFTPGSEGGS